MIDELHERVVLKQAKWDMLRSDIYIRDKGICWICNQKVELKDYDLGHLIDKCNGGQDDYDNLAVMHKKCNISKPRHNTLEEAMKWKLTASYLTARPIGKLVPKEQLTFISNQKQDNQLSPLALDPTLHYKHRVRRIQKLHIDKEDIKPCKELILEYFRNRPELLNDGINPERSEAIRQLSSTLNVPIQYIRRWMVEAGLVKARIIIADGSQYRFIAEHLEDLFYKYNYLGYSEKELGLSWYGICIMFYLAGMPERIPSKELTKIETKATKLGLIPKTIS